MSADALHAAVERSMKNRNVYDFRDFVESVEKAKFGTVNVAILSRQDIFLWPEDLDMKKIGRLEPRFYLRVTIKNSCSCYILILLV